MNVKALCIHMERYYLGHEPPPTPHTPTPHTAPTLHSVQPDAVDTS